MNSFKLKPGMLLGAASAAAQIEGGDADHSWMDWAHRGHIADGSSPARADDHFRRWREDTELMRSLGLQICRLGIEWARIETAPGVFDQDALDHYLDEIRLLKEYGIKPLVTLHHFANPMWFERLGAFSKKENLPYFLAYVEKVIRHLGGEAAEYITINEPNVYAVFGYFFGTWPPGEKSFGKTVRVMSVMAAAHIEAYTLIHKVRREMGFSDTRVSFAHHVLTFVPQNPGNPMHRIFARLNERFFQGALSRAMYRGLPAWPLCRYGNYKPGTYADFIGINYYTRSAVSGLDNGFKQGVPVNDLGWEIYPKGIRLCAEKLYALCPVPIYITENGTCDGKDGLPADPAGEQFRSRYIYEHLKTLCESALPVERYYHWCFCDNFEWLEGESARFGIVHVDYETQRRTVKPSGEFLSRIIQDGGVSEELYNRYVKDQRYKTN